ncbi:MAG: tetratricopeptide repeat protein [Alloprevotella sp.]|nr:tetratricopeptide repeat protein [Alloprevotella sp.]
MDLLRYTNHPELLTRSTLFQLREEVARHPYFVPARLLYLRNLFLLRDPDFGPELRNAALFVPDRNVLYQFVEGEIVPDEIETKDVISVNNPQEHFELLIDNFIAADEVEEEGQDKRPTAVDAVGDYASYLMQLDDIDVAQSTADTEAKTNHRIQLLNDFIDTDNPIELEDSPTYSPSLVDEGEDPDALNEDFFTETLARIYTKQGRYDKSMEILRKLNLAYPDKNPYFADQMRFLQKLIINDNHKK